MTESSEPERARVQEKQQDPPATQLPDVAYHLYSSFFQQVGVFAMAAAGGALLLLQVGFFKSKPTMAVVAAVLFAVSALLSLMGPAALLHGITEKKDVRRAVSFYIGATLFFLGTGTGALMMALIRSSFKPG